MTSKPTLEEAELRDKHRDAARAAATAAAEAFANLSGDSYDEWCVSFVAYLFDLDRRALEHGGYPAYYVPALKSLKTVLAMYGVE